MYKHKHLAPSSTSLSADDDDDDNDNETLNLAAHHAQWSTKTVISNLPPEILIHILKNLYTPKDLYNALRVSRAWCECAVELLWQKPSFARFPSLLTMILVISKPEEQQTFSYASLIRRLNLVNHASSLKDDQLVVLARCSRLERITLVNCDNLSSPALARALPAWPGLVAVDLTNVTNTNDDAIIGLAHAAPRLQGLNLTGCKNITDAAVSALASNCPLLRRLKLSECELITDTPISALAKSCPYLLEIDLNKCKLITDIAVRDIWTYCKNMREMRLSHCTELTDLAFPAPLKADTNNGASSSSRALAPNPFPSSFAALAESSDALPPLALNRSFLSMRMIDLTACALVTDDALEGIISHAPKLRNVVLSKCVQLTDRAVETICRLGKHLHYLHLGHATNITDRAVRTLARTCTRLRYVDFANCNELTDMSVFELSSLPKLRRVGLVRVNNLTDEAVYALAERHATLERIHLSYCDKITVPAIHFLLQKLHKLTHLSLTGVPAFRSPDLQAFCRPPPKEFNISQQAAFCVFSGKGVSQLRAYLTERFDIMNEMNGTDDTEYEEDDYDGDGEVDGDAEPAYEPYHEDETPEPLDEEMEEDGEGTQDGSLRTFIPPHIRNGHVMHRTRTAGVVRTRALAADGTVMAQVRQAPPVASGSGRSLADLLPLVEPSQSPPPSDVASNRSAGTNNSNGATFFRTYYLNQGQGLIHHGVNVGGAGGEGVVGLARSNGTRTPDLNFAEIGHGRGAQGQGQPPHPATGHPSNRRGVEARSNRVELRGSGPQSYMASQASTSREQQRDVPMEPDFTYAHRANTQQPAQQGTHRAVAWPYREPGETLSPATAQELQASLQNALGNVASHPAHRHLRQLQAGHADSASSSNPRLISSGSGTRSLTPATPPSAPQPERYSQAARSQAQLQSQSLAPDDPMQGSDGEARGRSVKRSLRNTLNAAEHYASSILFGRNAQEGGTGSSGTPSGSGSIVR
ncbi:hypothetical protein HGRIS_009431 [Hohenbuehelia grisea]|uniref:F-box domain-containing protein n=1 Tax=Hohenbuehelia grisea TaxID=104357 RepID=A0ABR3J1A1_9AGAR